MPQRNEQARNQSTGGQVFPSAARFRPSKGLSFFLFFTFSNLGFQFWLFITSKLKYAAVLFLLLAARPVFVFALGHFLLAHFPHEVEKHLRRRRRTRRSHVNWRGRVCGVSRGCCYILLLGSAEAAQLILKKKIRSMDSLMW